MRTLIGSMFLLLIACSSDTAGPPDASCGADAPIAIVDGGRDAPTLPTCASLGCDEASELVDPTCVLTGAVCLCGPVLCTF